MSDLLSNDVQAFITKIKDGTSEINNMLSKDDVNNIIKQSDAFILDIKKLESGKMTYGEMRALYG